MADVSVVKLKVRRGTDVQRKLITLDQGELGYTTDSQRLFIGDGNTKGGISAGIKFIADSVSNPTGLLPTAQLGDLVFNKDTSFYYILTGSPYTALSAYKPLTQALTTTYGAFSAGTIGAISPTLTTNYSPLTAQGASQLSVFQTLINLNAGLSASADLYLTNDTNNVAYLDMGINSSLYDGNKYFPTFNVVQRNDSYLYSVSGNLVIGTSVPTVGDLIFFTGGTLSGIDTNGGNEAMRITNQAGPYVGNVGINNSTPSQQLTVGGNISATGGIYASGPINSLGVVYASGGSAANSNQWTTVYSVVCAASAVWNTGGGANTIVNTASGRWNIGYTGYTNLTAATASTFLTNSISAGNSNTLGNTTVNGTINTVAIPNVAGSGNVNVYGNSIYTQPISAAAGYDLALQTSLTNRAAYFGGNSTGYTIQAVNSATSVAVPISLNPQGGSVGIGVAAPAYALSVVGTVSASNQIIANNGFYSVSSYSGTPYTDGIVVDYVTGNGRISVGPADNLTMYSGGVANTALVSVSSNGALSANGNVYGNTAVNIQPGNYTIVPTDNSTMIVLTNASAATVSASPSFTYPSGFQVGIFQNGAGRVTINNPSGSAPANANGFNKTRTQYSMATLMNINGGWVVFGDLAT